MINGRGTPSLAIAFALMLGAGARCHAAIAALEVAEGYVGTQTFGGELGYTFTVLSPVEIVSLGAFDSSANGLTGTITTQLWRATGTNSGPQPDDVFATGGVLLTSATFDSSSGSAAGTGTGYIYKSIAPITLASGVYVVSASGFGAADPNGNLAATNTAIDGNTGPLVRFGSHGYNLTAGLFPTSGDGWWSATPGKYSAGSFEIGTQTVAIIDNGDTGYSQTLFTNQADASAYNSTQAYNSTANNGGHADWQFTGLADGVYEIFATWDQDGQANLSPVAPYSFTPLGGTGGSTTANQESASGPAADMTVVDSNGSGLEAFDFQKIGAVTVKNGQIDVRLDAVVGGGASDFVFADAVAIRSVAQPIGFVTTVDWDPLTAASEGSTGTLNGIGVEVNSQIDFSNEGATFATTWTDNLATDDATGLGGAISEGAALGTGTIDVVFDSAVRNPLVFLNFLNADATVDFGSLDVTLLDSHNGALAVLDGESIVTMSNGISGSANDGFVVRLNGTFSAFSFGITSTGTTGITIGTEVPAPSAASAGLALLGLAAARRRRTA